MEIKKLLILSLFLFFVWPALADFPPLKTDEEVQAKFQSLFGSQTNEQFQRSFRRKGNKVIELETYAILQAQPKLFEKIMSDFKTAETWALKNINVRASGESYYAIVKDVHMDAKDPTLMHTLIRLEFPLFKQTIQRDYRLKILHNPFRIRMEAIPQEGSSVESSLSELRMFPLNANTVKLYFISYIRIKSRILYEVIPERLIQTEAGERIQTVFDNYHAEEDRLKK
jgi:hypothetical protein